MANVNLELERNDLDIIESIAKKYGVSVQDLSRSLLSRKYPRLQILLTVDELKHIDDNAKKLSLSRSMYCYMCFKKAMDDKLYENMNLLEIVKKSDTGKRTEKVAVSFSELGDYEKMVKFAKDLGVPFSGMLRYFSLTVNL